MNFDALLKHKPGEVRVVTSSANEAVKAIRALETKKYRSETGLFVAEGARTLIEALELGACPKAVAYLTSALEEPHVRRIAEAVQGQGGLLLEVNTEVLRKISARDNPQTILGVFEQQWGELVQLPASTPRILVLEQVRDPGNLGTIMRTADGFGVQHIVLVGETTDPYSLEAVRASMGSVFGVTVYRADLEAFTAFAKTYSGQISGTFLQGAVDIADFEWNGAQMLIMGNEQQGLSAAMRALCHRLIKIPMQGRADSFNLAIATGIALYASRKS